MVITSPARNIDTPHIFPSNPTPSYVAPYSGALKLIMIARRVIVLYALWAFVQSLIVLEDGLGLLQLVDV